VFSVHVATQQGYRAIHSI